MLRSTLSRSRARIGSPRALHYSAALPATRLCTRAAQCLPQAGPSRVHRRHFATPPPQVNVREDFSMEQYHEYADATMETMLDSLENLVDEAGQPEYEVDYSSGVLTLRLGEHGTYVINKQPPNKQIWLSSPTSGPKRYDYVPERDEWIYAREKRSLGELLNTELSQIFGREVDLKLSGISDTV